MLSQIYSMLFSKNQKHDAQLKNCLFKGYFIGFIGKEHSNYSSKQLAGLTYYVLSKKLTS